MGIWGRTPPYDRETVLERAGRARARGQRRKAIALYRHALAIERTNVDLHAKLAPLLAETGQGFDAWNSFRASAQAALRAGRDDLALAVYRDASKALPHEIQAWQAVARLLTRQGDEAAAVEVLVEGSQHFRAPFLRSHAIHLLRRARTIEPWHFETVIELSGLLRRTDQRAEAQLLLEGLAQRVSGRRLRRVHAAQLWLEPGPAALWRWARPPLESPVDEPAADLERDGVVPLRAVRR